VKLLALTLAIAACSSKDGGERTEVIIPVKQPEGVDTGKKPPIPLVTDDLPDDSWRKAAQVAAGNWFESFAKIGVKSAKVTPVRSPGGAAVPYLLQAEATGPDGKQVFHGIALVHGNLMINGGGKPRVTAYFKELGFPKTRIHVGHLVEILYISGGINASWLKPPSAAGWEQFDKPQPPMNHVTATLEYGTDIAVLVLYRLAAKGSGLERLEVTFAADGSYTQQAARQTTETAWEPFTP
jgi:hypothetical protein